MALVRTGLIGVLLILIGLTVWGWWVVISHFALGDYHDGGTVLVALVVAGCMTVWLVDVAHSLKLNLAAAPESGARLIFSPHPSDTDRVTPKSEQGRLIDHVKELSDRAGLPQVPRIYVSSDSFAHGAAAGIRHRRNYIVVSDFALERFDDTELKGLVAREIAHLLQRDSLILVLIDLVAGGLLKIPRFLAGTTKIVLLVAAVPAFIGLLIALYEEGPAVLFDVVEAGSIYAAVLATPFILLLAIGWPAAAIQRAVELRADVVAAELTSPATILRSLRAVQFLSPEGFAEERGIYDTVPTYKELVDSVKRLGGTADRRLEAFERDAETFGQRDGNLLLISRSACPRFLAFCKAAGAGILGIDCFRLDQGQPVALLEPMADFSELRTSAIGTFRVDSLRRARAFVDEVVEPDMWCEFVVDLPDSDDLMKPILQTLEDPSGRLEEFPIFPRSVRIRVI